jgi:hypothetical protein
MLYVPLVLAATVYIPLASMLNGVVNGVTLVLVVPMLLNVICQCVQCHLLFEATVTIVHASIGLFTTTVAVAVSQLLGFLILLMDWLHIIGR